ncbi:hypothetical protein VT03_10320 [Planctomyces sp. SH-PL14]|nr:hypothetical protein VT03_10320 [Planctomyces sp. SH-PL14]
MVPQSEPLMAKKQASPTSLRLDPENEQVYRELAAQIGISFPEWVRETLQDRAAKQNEWIKTGRAFRDKRGRLQFLDDFPPEEQERMAKLLKGK